MRPHRLAWFRTPPFQRGDTGSNPVTNAKRATLAADRIRGRANGAGAGDTQDLTPTQVRTIINVESGADVTDAANVAAAGAVMDSDISEGEGFLRKTGAGAYEGIKTNIGASVAPSGTDDSASGYAVGSRWIDTTANKEYVCVDASVGAALWTETTSAGAGGGDAWSDPVDAVITPDADSTRDLATTGTRFAIGFLDALDITNNIVVGGTVDGRDVAADGSKIDGIEALADVTDAANVIAALSGATLTGALTVADQLLTRPNIKDYVIESTTPAISSGTLTLDMVNGNDFDVAWNANITTLTVSNWAPSGTLGKLTLRLAMDGTTRTVAWPAGWKWPGGTEPSNPSINQDIFVTVWSRDGGATIYAAEIGQAFA